MKKMTTEEKLEHCINFIKKINEMRLEKYAIDDLVSIDAECVDCGSDEIDVSFKNNPYFYDPDDINSLKDEAWHVLADIMD